MSDVLSPDQRHINMAAIHSSSTMPELKLRHNLWRIGFRYKVNNKQLPGSPDIVLPKYRTVIFVHGCFWHGHKDCKNASIPKTNTDFWLTKITRNKERDQEVWRQLEAKGWSVIIVWECELKKSVMDKTIARVEAVILHNGKILQQEKENRRKVREAYRLENRFRKEREATLIAELRHK